MIIRLCKDSLTIQIFDHDEGLHTELFRIIDLNHQFVITGYY